MMKLHKSDLCERLYIQLYMVLVHPGRIEFVFIHGSPELRKKNINYEEQLYILIKTIVKFHFNVTYIFHFAV